MLNVVREAVGSVLEIENISTISQEENLRNYGLDSLSAVEIIVSIEDILGVEMDDEDLLVEKVDSLLKIKQLYEKYKSRVEKDVT